MIDYIARSIRDNPWWTVGFALIVIWGLYVSAKDRWFYYPTCPHCKEDIKRGATVCPHCTRDV